MLHKSVVESIVNRVVVAGCFDRCLRACVLLGDFVEIRILDTNLSIDLTVIVQNSGVRFVFVDVDSEVVHRFLWGGNAWEEPYLFEVVARMPGRQSGLAS